MATTDQEEAKPAESAPTASSMGGTAEVPVNKKLGSLKPTSNTASAFSESNSKLKGVTKALKIKAAFSRSNSNLSGSQLVDMKNFRTSAFSKEIFEHKRKDYEMTIAETTDSTIAAANPCGDGDQSFLKADVDEDPGLQLKNIWRSQADFNPIYFPNNHSKFMIACYKGDVVGVMERIRLTRDREVVAKKTEQDHSKCNYMERLLESRESMLRFTPLMGCIAGAKAALKDNGQYKRLAKALIAAGARVNAKDICGNTVVHHCTDEDANTVSCKLVKTFVQAGADVNMKNRFHNTPLAEAVLAKRLDCISVLCEYGADPHVKGAYGISAFKLLQWMSVVVEDAQATSKNAGKNNDDVTDTDSNGDDEKHAD